MTTGRHRRLKIWVITVGEPVPVGDEKPRLWRTGLLAQILANRGHEVVWWTSRVNHFTKTYFPVDREAVTAGTNLTIRFLNGHLYKKNISVARQINHWQIASEFRRLSRLTPRPDLIVCSYPTIELSKESVILGRRWGIPVVVDVRDLWPDELEARIPSYLRPIGRVVLRPMYNDASLALRGATAITGCSRRYVDWALAIADRAPTHFDEAFPHGYPAPRNLDEGAPLTESRGWLERLGLEGQQRVFWFAGNFVSSVILETVIEAARMLLERTDVLFVLSGSGERDGELRERARGLSNVVFTGWLNQSELHALAKRAWVGLVPYKGDSRVTLPNKLFEYMAFGLPVLTSLQGEARSLVEAAQCGMYFAAGSPESLVDGVVSLADDPGGRARMALSARREFEEHYSANTVYGRFADHLESVVSECHGTSMPHLDGIHAA